MSTVPPLSARVKTRSLRSLTSRRQIDSNRTKQMVLANTRLIDGRGVLSVFLCVFIFVQYFGGWIRWGGFGARC